MKEKEKEPQPTKIMKEKEKEPLPSTILPTTKKLTKKNKIYVLAILLLVGIVGGIIGYLVLLNHFTVIDAATSMTI